MSVRSFRKAWSGEWPKTIQPLTHCQPLAGAMDLE